MSARKQQDRGWVTSSFGDFGSSSTSAEKKPVKRRHLSDHSFLQQSKKKVKKIGDQLWVDLYQPLSKDDLAVHKKKIQEVETWLTESMAGMKGRHYLLLTGPAGCGKTATIRALAAELSLNIQEWINPTSLSYAERFTENYLGPGDTVPYTSQAAQFKEFFVRSTKYNNICIVKSSNTCRQSIVLVEDFPNCFSRESSDFHSLIRRYKSCGKHPVIFIVSDSTNQQSNVKHLFPPELLAELSIVNISFNPVASSLLVRALNKVITSENNNEDIFTSHNKQILVTRETLQGLADASKGDVRSAINALQFACRKDISQLEDIFQCNSSSKSEGYKKLKKKSSSTDVTTKKCPKGNNNLTSIGAKDPSIFLFRALGKVLHCKRHNDQGIIDELPKHLKCNERTALQENPENIYEHSTMNASSFSLFLHHNYLPFINNLDVLAKVSENFTDADILNTEWTGRDVLDKYAASVSIRGLMHANDGTASKVGWKPLTRPHWYNAVKKINNQLEVLRRMHQNSGLFTEELTTTLVPYSAKILNSSLYMEVGTISRNWSTSHFNEERINENDVDNESETVETATESSNQSKFFASTTSIINSESTGPHQDDNDSDEDYLIEEFDN